MLAADTNSPNSKLAAHALVGSGRTMAEALASLTDVQLHQFAQTVYQRANGPRPLVTALMRSRRRVTLSRWFANQIAAGQVPRQDQWAAEFGDARELLALVVGNDPIVALGAAAALVGSAGGDDERARIVAADLRGLDDPNPELLESTWDELRGQIFVARMEQTAGSYRLSLRIYAAAELRPIAHATRRPAPPPSGRPGSGFGLLAPPTRQPFEQLPTEGKPEVKCSLGVVQLRVEDGTVYLGNKTIAASVHKDHLAIVIDQPQDLKNLAEDLGKLEFESVDSLELLPDHGAGWRGVMRLDDGRTLELLLKPDST